MNIIEENRNTSSVIDLTVVIPTYNGENRLPKVLDRLKSQINTENIAWEVIVVDNNSTDNTAKVVKEHQKSWPKAYPLRYYFEPKQGRAFAKQRAVEEARGESVGFMDDDCLPAADWVEKACAFGKRHSKAAAYSSQVHARFEVTPPKNFERIAPLLGIVERGPKAHIYEPQKRVLPPSIGLVVRKKIWLTNVPATLTLRGSEKDVDDLRLGGEDIEALLYIQKAGCEIWYNPEMCVYHLIPPWRLERDYLLKLCRGIGLGRYFSRKVRLKSWPRPFALLACMINDVRRLVFYVAKHKGAIKTDLVAECEMEYLWASLIGPFYFLKRRIKDE